MASPCLECTNFIRLNGGPKCKLGYTFRKTGERCEGQNQPRALRYQNE